VVQRYAADRAALGRRYAVDYSPARRERFRTFTAGWRARLAELDFDRLGVEGRLDWVLLDNALRHQLALLDRERLFAEMALLPFAERLMALEARRRDWSTRGWWRSCSRLPAESRR
jgi:hypothetical protein